MADRIVLLRDGIIEQQGAPLDLYERPATRYVAGFLGSPAMNFISATLVNDGSGLALRLSDGTLLALPVDRQEQFAAHRDKDVTLGIRPEHINRAANGDLRPGVIRHEATIELFQPTGSRTYATFVFGGVECLAELQAHDVSRVNEQIGLSIDMNRAVLIDPQSDKVL